jgi:hypothetical protein
MQLDAEWKPVLGVTHKDILSTDNRRILVDKAGLSKSNFAKYTKMFKDKGILIKNSLGGTEVNGIFMPKDTSGIIEVTFTLDTE